MPFVGAIARYLKTSIGILAAFAVLCILLSIATPNFRTTTNVLNVLRTVSTNAFLAIGVMMAITLGGIDLTGGAMLALSGCVMVKFMVAFEMSIPLAMICALIVGLVAGFLNGTIIATITFTNNTCIYLCLIFFRLPEVSFCYCNKCCKIICR